MISLVFQCEVIFTQHDRLRSLGVSKSQSLCYLLQYLNSKFGIPTTSCAFIGNVVYRNTEYSCTENRDHPCVAPVYGTGLLSIYIAVTSHHIYLSPSSMCIFWYSRIKPCKRVEGSRSKTELSSCGVSASYQKLPR